VERGESPLAEVSSPEQSLSKDSSISPQIGSTNGVPFDSSLARLTREPVARTLVGMAVPMLAGTFSMTAYNLTDTYYVARLGTAPLAAMSFTFPIVMLLSSAVMGLGTGVTASVSHALGRHDHALAQRLSTHTLILSVLLTLILSVGGLLTLKPVFRLLGAEGEVFDMTCEYMRVWYWGIATIVLPMIACNIVRATGNTVSPSLLMMFGALLNVVLAPIMIYGLVGFPRWGLFGAALATVISQGVSGVFILWILHHRHRLLCLEIPRWNDLCASWVEVLRLGIPCCLASLLIPISSTLITRLVSGYGPEAVAACGAAGRVEMFAFLVPMALGFSLVPFVGQNFGANRLDRVIRGRFLSNLFVFLWGGFVCIVLGVVGRPVAALFSQDAQVIETLTLYLRIVPIGYGMMEIHRYTGFLFNGVQKPFYAMMVNLLRVVVLLIPFSMIGSRYLGLRGIFAGRVVADIISALVGLGWGQGVLKTLLADSFRGFRPGTETSCPN
jgi:putative MATE family efflux protein